MPRRMKALTGNFEKPDAAQAARLEEFRRKAHGLARLREVAECLEVFTAHDVCEAAGEYYRPGLLATARARGWIENTGQYQRERGGGLQPLVIWRSLLYQKK